MALSIIEKTQLLKAYYESFNGVIKNEILNGKNQNEKLALCLAHYKGWQELDYQYNDTVLFTVHKNNSALFGFGLMNIYVDQINEVLNDLRYLGCYTADKFQNYTVESFVSEIKRFARPASKQATFPFEQLAMHCAPSMSGAGYSPSNFDVVCPFSGEITEFPTSHLLEANATKAGQKFERLSTLSVAELFKSGDEQVRELLNNCCWVAHAYNAERAALNLEHTETLTEDKFVAAIAGCVGFINHMAAAFSCHSFQVNFPKACTALRKKLLESVDSRTVETILGSGRGPSRDWFEIAEKSWKGKLCFADCVRDFLLYFLARDENGQIVFCVDKDTVFQIGCWGEPVQFFEDEQKKPIEEMLDLNKLDARKSSFECVRAVKKTLKNKVIGQGDAVESVSSALATILLKGGEKHLGTSAFLGMSGTGKTHMAEAIGDSFVNALTLDYQVHVINMEQYADSRDVLKLFGSGSQYVDAALGELTLSVMKNPRAVIVFDEIEKAHGEVIQALLTLFDKGLASDRTSQRAVNFSLCHFVITTNLGSTALQSFSSASSIDVVELLTRKTSDKDRALSPEMANRLAAGNIALFRELDANTMISIAKRACRKVASASPIRWPQNPEEIVLATLGGSVSPRSIATQLSKLEGRILNEQVDALPEDKLEILNNISVSPDSFLEQSGLKVDVLSDRKQFGNFVADGISVYENTSPEVLEKLLNGGADIVLVDNVILEKTSEKSMTLLKRWSSKTVVTLGMSALPPRFAELISAGVIHSHMILAKQASENEYNALIGDIKRIAALVKYVRVSIARNLKPQFTFQYVPGNDSVEVSVKEFSYKPAVRTEDAELPFLTFAGKPEGSLNDVIGLESTKNKLKLIIESMTSTPSSRESKLPVPKGYLFTGLPGTGKTHMARSLAAESDMFFFGVNSADLLVGNAITNVKKLFEIACRYAPSVIFLDEIDSIAKSRQSTSHSAGIVVNALLTAMDGFSRCDGKVFVMAATNNPHELDSALTRAGRFDRSVHFDLPCKLARAACVSQWFKEHKLKLTQDMQAELICLLEGATIGRIREIFNDSLLSARAESTEWQPNLLTEAIRSAKLGAVSRSVKQSKEQIRVTAFHEAGHLIAHKLLLPDVPVDFVSVQPRGAALGMVVPGSSEDEPMLTRKRVKTYLQVYLAGIAAEQMIGLSGDSQTTGGSDDRRKATQLAKNAILHWGMSDDLGLVMPSELKIDESVILGQVSNWLDDAYEDVFQLLSENAILLNALSSHLLDNEQLNRKEIDALFKYKSESHNLAA